MRIKCGQMLGMQKYGADAAHSPRIYAGFLRFRAYFRWCAIHLGAREMPESERL